MPRPSRDDRRAELARTAQRWGQWLSAALAEQNLEIKQLVDLAGQAGATFDKSNVSKWRAGDSSADPTNAVIIARVLGRDPLEALRVAGYDLLANQLAARPSVDDVLRAAKDADASAPVLLREAGHADVADYIEAITGPGGPRPVDLDAAIAQTRVITDSMTPDELDAYEERLLNQIRDTRRKARDAASKGLAGNGKRNGTQGAS